MTIPHPGLLLLDEIERQGLSVYSVAAAAKVTQPVIHSITTEDARGKRRAITPRTALLLERTVPGRSAEEWMRLQAAYDLAQARHELREHLEQLAPARPKRAPKRTDKDTSR